LAEERTKMIKELKKWVIPELNNMGFTGVFPHYRRNAGKKIDLLMFQFNKWGGSFLIEISYVLTEGGKSNLVFENKTSIEKITVPDTNIRYRLKTMNNDVWFYYYDVAEIKIGGKKTFEPIKPSIRQSYEENYQGKVKWLQLVDDSIYEKLAKEVLKYLGKAENWWRKMPQENGTSQIKRLFKNLICE
jgi:hypothetical protein